MLHRSLLHAILLIAVYDQQPCSSKYGSSAPTKRMRDIEFQVDDNSSDDEDDTICKFCRSKWRRIKGVTQIWRVCELCDRYVCPKCLPKDIQVDEDFVCRECSWYLEWFNISKDLICIVKIVPVTSTIVMSFFFFCHICIFFLNYFCKKFTYFFIFN